MSRILLNRTVVPTTAASQFFRALTAAGIKAFNLGQGREQQDPPEHLRKLLAGETSLPSSGYNTESGGMAPVKETVASWLNAVLRLDAAAADNTFIFPKHGREILDASVTMLNDSGEVMLPASRWPTLDKIFGYLWSKKNYDYGDWDAVCEQVANNPPKVFYINPPHNPTGTITTPAQWAQLLAALSHGKTTLIIDAPYFHANPDHEQGGFDTGFDQLTRDSNIPWVAIFSGSKAFGTADRGLSFAVCSDNLLPNMRDRAAIIGFSYSQSVMEGIRQAFSADYIQDWMGFFASMREKYKINRATLASAFNGVAGVRLVDGDPGMTALLEIEPEALKEEYKDLNNVIEELGNQGVVVVNNGYSPTGKAWIRAAMAAPTPEFREGATILRNGFTGTILKAA